MRERPCRSLRGKMCRVSDHRKDRSGRRGAPLAVAGAGLASSSSSLLLASQLSLTSSSSFLASSSDDDASQLSLTSSSSSSFFSSSALAAGAATSSFFSSTLGGSGLAGFDSAGEAVSLSCLPPRLRLPYETLAAAGAFSPPCCRPATATPLADRSAWRRASAAARSAFCLGVRSSPFFLSSSFLACADGRPSGTSAQQNRTRRQAKGAPSPSPSSSSAPPPCGAPPQPRAPPPPRCAGAPPPPPARPPHAPSAAPPSWPAALRSVPRQVRPCPSCPQGAPAPRARQPPPHRPSSSSSSCSWTTRRPRPHRPRHRPLRRAQPRARGPLRVRARRARTPSWRPPAPSSWPACRASVSARAQGRARAVGAGAPSPSPS